MPTSPHADIQPIPIALDAARHPHAAWPKVATTSTGAVVLAFSAGRTHGAHGEGCPVVCISKDDGATFGEPTVLAEFTRDDTYTHCGNLAIGVTRDDVILIIAMAYRGDEASSIFGWASIDEGDTWQEINVATLAAGRTGSVYGRIFHVQDRGYAVTGHFRPGSYPNEQGLWIAFSDDGLHWNAPSLLTEQKVAEPAALAPDSERILGLGRPNTDRFVIFQASRRRFDWTVTDAPIVASQPDTRLVSPSLFSDGECLFCLASERTIPGNVPGRIILWSSDLDATSWTSHGPVIEFPNDPELNDFGYPWAVQQKDGNWWCTFYHGTRNGPCSLYTMTLDLSSMLA